MSIKNYLKLYKKSSTKKHSLTFYLVENFKVVQEIIKINPRNILALFITPEFFAHKSDFFVTHRNIPQQIIKISELKNFSSLSTNKQLIAVISKPVTPVYQGHYGLALVLENIQNPNNLGAIIRNAKWFGVQHIFCSPNSVDLYNPKVIQASMGAHLSLNIYYQPLIPLLRNNSHAMIIASSTVQRKSHYQPVQLFNQSFLIMGNESHGISEDLIAMATNFIHIPKIQDTESLNVAVANGIILQQLLGAKIEFWDR